MHSKLFHLSYFIRNYEKQRQKINVKSEVMLVEDKASYHLKSYSSPADCLIEWWKSCKHAKAFWFWVFFFFLIVPLLSLLIPDILFSNSPTSFSLSSEKISSLSAGFLLDSSLA